MASKEKCTHIGMSASVLNYAPKYKMQVCTLCLRLKWCKHCTAARFCVNSKFEAFNKQMWKLKNHVCKNGQWIALQCMQFWLCCAFTIQKILKIGHKSSTQCMWPIVQKCSNLFIKMFILNNKACTQLVV